MGGRIDRGRAGVYSGVWQVDDGSGPAADEFGRTLLKESTFFPDAWQPVDVETAIGEVWVPHSERAGVTLSTEGRYDGETRGVRIRCWYLTDPEVGFPKVDMAYPTKRQPGGEGFETMEEVARTMTSHPLLADFLGSDFLGDTTATALMSRALQVHSERIAATFSTDHVGFVFRPSGVELTHHWLPSCPPEVVPLPEFHGTVLAFVRREREQLGDERTGSGVVGREAAKRASETWLARDFLDRVAATPGCVDRLLVLADAALHGGNESAEVVGMAVESSAGAVTVRDSDADGDPSVTVALTEFIAAVTAVGVRPGGDPGTAPRRSAWSRWWRRWR